MSKFTYEAPPTLFDCLKLLQDNPKAKVLAGGTDLLVKIRNKVLDPKMVIDLKKIDKLRGIRLKEDGSLVVGALTTHTEVSRNALVMNKYPFLAAACSVVGSTQIRNRGTIGGNICNGSPAADSLPPLYILDAKVHLESVIGTRVIPITGLCCGPSMTCIAPGEIVTAIEISPIQGEYKGSYHRQGRRKVVSIAMVTAAAMWREDSSKATGMRFSIALGSVAPTVIRAINAENFMNQAAVCSDEILDEAALTALKDARPISDVRTTCDYRNDLIYVLVRRCLKDITCGEEAKG